MASLPNYLKPLATLLPELVAKREIPKLVYPSVCLRCGEDLEHLECVNGYDERCFITMRDGEHGPFCSEACADSFAINYDDREPPASAFYSDDGGSLRWNHKRNRR